MNKHNKLIKIFDDWLFLPKEEREKQNPFAKMLEQAHRNLPRVPKPKFN